MKGFGALEVKGRGVVGRDIVGVVVGEEGRMGGGVFTNWRSNPGNLSNQFYHSSCLYKRIFYILHNFSVV